MNFFWLILISGNKIMENSDHEYFDHSAVLRCEEKTASTATVGFFILAPNEKIRWMTWLWLNLFSCHVACGNMEHEPLSESETTETELKFSKLLS